MPLYLLLAHAGPTWLALITLLVVGVGVWASSVVSRDLGVEDPQHVVIDEVAGFLITMQGARASLATVLVGFALFRLLDIAKPWPVRALERLPSGWGIVLDDVAAGAIGAGLMFALRAAHLLA